MLLAYIVFPGGVLYMILSLLGMTYFIIETILHFIVLNKYLVVVFGTEVEISCLHTKLEE